MAEKIKTKWANPEVSQTPAFRTDSGVESLHERDGNSQKSCTQLFSFSNELPLTLIK